MKRIIQEGFALYYDYGDGTVVCREVWRTKSYFYTKVYENGELKERTRRISESEFITFLDEYHNA